MNLLIKNFPGDLHKGLKVWAAEYEISLKDLIKDLLKKELKTHKANKEKHTN